MALGAKLKLCEVREYGDEIAKDVMIRLETTCPCCHRIVPFTFPKSALEALGKDFRDFNEDMVKEIDRLRGLLQDRERQLARYYEGKP